MPITLISKARRSGEPACQKTVWAMRPILYMVSLFSECDLEEIWWSHITQKFTETRSLSWISRALRVGWIDKRNKRSSTYHPDNSEIVGCDVDVFGHNDNQILYLPHIWWQFSELRWWRHLIAISNKETANRVPSNQFLDTKILMKAFGLLSDHFNTTS